MTETYNILKQAENLAKEKDWTINFALSVIYSQLQARNKLDDAETCYRLMQKRVMVEKQDDLLKA